ncbi:MAG: Hsp33 family molecular chaperone HslO, partial [Spirochaetaceae bacterium]|nr:Hsp33 family molecular chaperone HslO [Spirochaetaceae bacterium]
MIKAPLSEDQLEVLERLAPDGAVVFTLGCGACDAAGARGAEGAGATLRGAILQGTRAIAQMRANHRLSAAGTILLGRAYLCAGLMSASLKGGDAVAIRFDGDGSARGLSVEV